MNLQMKKVESFLLFPRNIYQPASWKKQIMGSSQSEESSWRISHNDMVWDLRSKRWYCWNVTIPSWKGKHRSLKKCCTGRRRRKGCWVRCWNQREGTLCLDVLGLQPQDGLKDVSKIKGLEVPEVNNYCQYLKCPLGHASREVVLSGKKQTLI